MDKFTNITDNGNEKAIRKGHRVPDDAVNLAWVTSPGLNPEDNLAVIDTSAIYSENSIDVENQTAVMYANALGVLETYDGNQLIEDEYPVVSDVFSVDEDFSLVPGSEYKPEHVLGFVHKSRFFHIDYAGLCLGSTLQAYPNEAVQVVNSKGQNYVDQNGNPRYRIQITPAQYLIEDNDREALYRVYAYVDTDLNEDLYLRYNCVQLNEENKIGLQRSDHREILNPKPYFQQTPEESEVVDPANRKKKQFATQPIGKKDQLLGTTASTSNGYKVYVPKKAVGDTRAFQLFRWRVGCTFSERFTVDPIRDPQVIRAGVIVTNSRPQSDTAFTFYNLERSNYNAAGLKFVNPLVEENPNNSTPKTSRNYWQVNINTLSDVDMAKFDILIWTPGTTTFNMEPFLGKIINFTGNHGGTMIFDTNNLGRISGLGLEVGYPIDPRTRVPTVPIVDSNLWKYVKGWTMRFTRAEQEILAQAQVRLGGWDLYDRQGTAELYTINRYRINYKDGDRRDAVQRIISKNSNWVSVLEGEDEANNYRPLVVRSKANNGTNSTDYEPGNLIFSTIGITQNVSYLLSHVNGKISSTNSGTSIASTPDYDKFINGHLVEGSYKFMYNIALLAVYGKRLDSTDESLFSSTWTQYTNWEGSWAINNDEGVLSTLEIQENDFQVMPESPTNSNPVWKRQLSGQTVKQLIDGSMSEADKRKVQGTHREYFIEVTNPEVSTEERTSLSDNSVPYAWTKAYTPAFKVPAELGPHIIRKDNIIGDYSQGNFMHKSYPSKSFGLRVVANNVATEQHHVPKVATYRATADVTLVRTTGATNSTESILNWVEDGRGTYGTSTRPHEYGLQVPEGLVTWQDGNYYSSKWGPGNLNWPHWGMTERLSRGVTSDTVAFLHHALNQVFNSPTGKFGDNDRYYGSKSESAVRAFQQAFGARFVDGIVDAETWFLLGNQIARRQGTLNVGRFGNLYSMPSRHILKQNASDNSDLTRFVKRSSTRDSPAVIWEMLKIELEDKYRIHGVTVIPYLMGNARDIMFRSVDVRNFPVPMKDYDSRSGKLTYMPFRPRHGQRFHLPFGPYNGDTVILGFGQDKPSGWGTSRVIGLQDVLIHTTGGRPNGTTQVINTTVEITGTITLPKTGEYEVTLRPPAGLNGTVTNILWTSIEVLDNTDVSAEIKDARKGLASLTSFYISNLNNSKIVYGPAIASNYPENVFYSMNENRVLNPGRETCRISKTDGIKLICTSDRKPYGVPKMGAAAGANELQNHFTSLTINRFATDHSVQLGFYDVAAKEMIRNVRGEPEISYLEWLRRGPDNIFVALISNYSEDTKTPFPPVDNAPLLPYLWAMPVYGLTYRKGSVIQIEKPSRDLDFYDLWSLPIRTGNFDRKVTLPRQTQQPITGFYSQYQGATLEAHYEIAEAEKTPWSLTHGRPYRDISDETPRLLDERTVQVRQPPIRMVDAPTQNPGPADPARPVFKVYVRESVGAPWGEVPLSEIRDYNASDGTIVLNEALNSTNRDLVKVSYTSGRPVYYYKGTKDEPLILNPYLNESHQYLETPIYIGLVPKYVKNLTPGNNYGQIIPESVTDETLSWTLDLNSKLDPSSPEYNPFYVQLGVVYITAAANINKLAIVDSRRRGGGAKDGRTLEDLQKSMEESQFYWDVNHGSGLPYQVGGFVTIRLPASLKDRFTKDEITGILSKNITAGVMFKIEDLDGQEWGE